MTPEQRLVIRCTELEAEVRGMELVLDAMFKREQAAYAWMREARAQLFYVAQWADDSGIVAECARLALVCPLPAKDDDDDAS